jgi:hypothetical protein
MQLVAYGAQDVYLTGNPQITFFKVVYRRHTNFSMESIEQTVEGKAELGARLTCAISRNGDLLGRTWVEMKLTGDLTKACNRVGFAILKEVELKIGGQLIDKHSGQWMNLWTELTHTDEQKRLLDEMVGGSTTGRRSNLGAAGTPKGTSINNESGSSIVVNKKVYVPLQFFFCRNPGVALPLISLQYHNVELVFNIESNTVNLDKFKNDAGAIKLDSLTVWSDYIFLDSAERKRFAQAPGEYLIEQVQMLENKSLAGAANVAEAVRLSFNHPVKELVWAAKLMNSQGNSGSGGDPFSNFTAGAAGSETEGTLSHSKIVLNGNNRISERNANYFSNIQPYQHHTGIPAVGINVYSFALNPEEHQPSGTLNFSRI